MYFYKASNGKTYQTTHPRLDECKGLKFKLQEIYSKEYHIVSDLVKQDNCDNNFSSKYNDCKKWHYVPDPIIFPLQNNCKNKNSKLCINSTASGILYYCKWNTITNSCEIQNKPVQRFLNNKFTAGINLTGYDNNDNFNNGDKGINELGIITPNMFLNTNLFPNLYSLNIHPTDLIDWVYNGSGQIIRFPISPVWIFNTTKLSNYSANHFLPIFNGNWTNELKCANKIDPTSYILPCDNSCPNYLEGIKKAAKKGIYSIIDLHADYTSLCNFGHCGNPQNQKSSPMTPEIFKGMWSHIVTYIITTISSELHEYIMFELYNEPIGTQDDDDYPCKNITGCAVNAGDGASNPIASRKCQQIWDNDYIIPTIKEIKRIEASYNSAPHIILATTYNNWSGVHSWKDDGTLQQLAIDLSANKLHNSSENYVLIAGHQYCDRDYSGEGTNDCNTKAFNNTKQIQFITDTSTILAPYNLKWVQTEGNINLNSSSTISIPNADLYNDWINKLKNDNNCLGITLWYANYSANDSVNDSAKGDTTEGEMLNLQTYNEYYSKIYNTKPNNAYQQVLPYDFNKLNEHIPS